MVAGISDMVGTNHHRSGNAGQLGRLGKYHKYVSTLFCVENTWWCLLVQQHHCYASSVKVSERYNYVHEIDG